MAFFGEPLIRELCAAAWLMGGRGGGGYFSGGSWGEAGAQVDIASWKSKTARVHVQIKDLCAILCALVVAQDYRRGQALVQHRSFKDNAAFFQV